MCAAAASGRLPFCRWLAAAGCPTDDRALAAAAGAGHAELCEWLALGCARGVSAAQAAAEGGHAALAERLLPPDWGPEPAAIEVGLLLAAVAAGCDLATLQRLHDAWAPLQQRGAAADADAGAGAGAGAVLPHPTPPGPLLDSWSGLRVVTAAIGSATPDWAAKVGWLAGRGYPLQVDCWERAARRPDWLPRLGWLGARGLPPDVRAVTAAARAGQLEGLSYILDDCGVQVAPEQRGCVVAEAVRGGHLPVLRELGRRGWGLGPGEAGVGSSVQQAAMLGHGGVAAWLAEGAGQRLGAEVATAAAAGGSLEVLRWAVSRGCALGERAFAAAAEWGSEEMVEWLAARSCPMGDDGAAYVHAARNGDLAMLACLRRLRCPWAASGDTLTRAVAQGCRLPLLRWLIAEGCPADWAAAARASQRGWRRDAELLGWLRAQRRAAAVRARVCACGSRFRMRRDEGDDTSALVAGEFSAALARQRGNADELFDHLSASQDELGQQLGRLAAALAAITAAAAAASPALPPGCSGTLARLQRKAADLSIRLGRVEQRLQRVKARLDPAPR
ncbi:Ankyrin repeat domain-containing protein [Tetrabaena socialis]|uniref:Ankyrin repeat domain-containing protein n=1 Tax=Tetrabaena socialis TaxID=47790 RepID=A0A2J8A4S7_9CHLO|nr:Ankyrin repeat domain-containing protein [Tetrabaena socialis]|eukprot:PNH07518.1 Ankyrin repeat domain-containing protein [Tetrabaena socialis]